MIVLVTHEGGIVQATDSTGWMTVVKRAYNPKYNAQKNYAVAAHICANMNGSGMICCDVRHYGGLWEFHFCTTNMGE